jgi:hypothetical protein|tara:strand:- start:566 stop:1057 length:492 start_codon:yes stop_codon:yes gene_type:complete
MLTAADLKFYESTNNLGGSPNFTTEVNPSENGFWDLISGEESSSGDVEYRCLYVRNISTTNDLLTPSIELIQDSADPDTSINIAVLDNVNETTVVSPNESTAPAGSPTWYGAGVDIPFNANLTFDAGGNGDFIAIWVRRTVANTNNLTANNSCIYSLKGQTSS